MSPLGAARATAWVVEVHVDQRWYQLRRSPEPMPAPGQHRTLALDTDRLLIGRGHLVGMQALDLAPDTGVSRRHAQLELVEGTWHVRDLNSHNGTWVTDDPRQLPTRPITDLTALRSGSSLLLGSWTRLVLRRVGQGALSGLLR